MRNSPNLKAEKYRVAGDQSLGNNGAFIAPGPRGRALKILISDGGGWDHVSVSAEFATPDWDEMEFVRKLFFRDDEWAVQYGVPGQAHVSFHETCLHWWRPQCETLPRPPQFMVGPTPEVLEIARACGPSEAVTRAESVLAVNRIYDASPTFFRALKTVLEELSASWEPGAERVEQMKSTIREALLAVGDRETAERALADGVL